MTERSVKPSPRTVPWLEDAAAAAGVVLVQLVLVQFVRSQGLVALSDDDFARVVIAQEFATRPSWDPSGSSWLPVPFWGLGLWMRATTATFAQAQAAATLMACVGSVSLYFSARFLRMRRTLAVGAALLAMTVPYAARLAATVVPEFVTACWIILGLCSLSLPKRGGVLSIPPPSPTAPTKRSQFRSSFTAVSVGALALALAAGSRYEAWPVAGFFFLFLTLAAVRQRRPALAAVGLVPLLVPAAWMLHGVAHHGDALFFVTRVTEYKRAVDGSSASLASLWSGYPQAIIVHEPQVMAATLAALAGASYFVGREGLKALEPPSLGLGLMLLVLMLGQAGGGAATHHPERTVLSVWMFATLALGCALDRLARSHQPTRRVWATLSVALLVAAVSWPGRSLAGRVDLAQRKAELALGQAIHRQLAEDQPVAVWTPDFGYFAIMAAAAHPQRFSVIDRQDPRTSKHSENRARQRVVELLESGKQCFVVVPLAWSMPDGVLLAQAGDLGVFRGLGCRQ